MRKRFLIIAMLLPNLARSQDAPRVDFHQHLFSPEAAAFVSPPPPGERFNPILAQDVVTRMDAAGIRRAVVLSTAGEIPAAGSQMSAPSTKT
jgi:hypothetical protein